MFRYKNRTLFLLSFISLLFAGCSVNPPYVFRNGEAAAQIRLIDMAKVSMCKDGKFYDIRPRPGAKYARVPAGGRITIGHFIHISDYNYSHSCYPFMSFEPKKGMRYVTNSGIFSNKCFIELVREDITSPTGVSMEDSVGPRNCYEQDDQAKGSGNGES